MRLVYCAFARPPIDGAIKSRLRRNIDAKAQIGSKLHLDWQYLISICIAQNEDLPTLVKLIEEEGGIDLWSIADQWGQPKCKPITLGRGSS